jgi:primosomal protein N' (replication factor Y)
LNKMLPKAQNVQNEEVAYTSSMRFYTVWVRSLSFRGHDPLTYSAAQNLKPGALVLVPLQRESVIGFIDREVAKPSFATKPISHVFALPALPAALPRLALWLQQFYGSSVGVAGQQLLPAALSDKTIEKLEPVVASTFSDDLPPLTPDQQTVVLETTKTDTYLLHGTTGSGKTRIYLELAIRTLQAGKSAIVLTPEISLTSQLSASFRHVFGEQVVVLHSQLTPAQRQQVWLKILTTTVPLVVIGPRSALFSPLDNIGLIVVDEAHETAYKQEQAPYYHAVRVASQLAHEHKATLILGSATPSIGDYFLAEQRHKPILRLSQLAKANDHADTVTTIVDLKDQAQFTRSRQLSTPLLTAIQAALSRGEQSLVYLNRRGTARVVLCENCGWQALCPHCDLPLVYHADSGTFRCHTCGHHEPIVTSCPTCGHPSVTFRSFGTKAIFEEVQKLFPEARVQRFDTDNNKAERFEQHYESVKAGDVDILIGTQMLAKGLDLPRLSTLGIVLADSSLFLPDFSAQERTYQLLTQVLGRVGRGHSQGHSIIQTYHPESPILEAAIAGEWDNFYATELGERQKFHFPPFYHLLKLSCRRATAKSAEAAADKLKIAILLQLPSVEVDGPAPSFHEKLQGKYQYQLVVRSTRRSDLLSVIKLLPASGWNYDIDPVNLL